MTDEQKDAIEQQRVDLANLAEAAASINFFVTSEDGTRYQVTLRDVDENRLLDRIAKVKVKLMAKGATPEVAEEKVGDEPRHNWCEIHNTEMSLWEKEGRSWYSHKDDVDGWCKGLVKE